MTLIKIEITLRNYFDTYAAQVFNFSVQWKALLTLATRILKHYLKLETPKAVPVSIWVRLHIPLPPTHRIGTAPAITVGENAKFLNLPRFIAHLFSGDLQTRARNRVVCVRDAGAWHIGFVVEGPITTGFEKRKVWEGHITELVKLVVDGFSSKMIRKSSSGMFSFRHLGVLQTLE